MIRKEEIHENGDRFTTHYKYNLLSQCISNTNAYGQEIKQKYDAFGRVIEQEYPPLVDATGELKTPVTKTQYNCANQPIVVTDELGRETHTEFNVRGQPIKITHPNGTVERFVYRLDGQLLSKTDKAGVITCYQRDPLGRMIGELVYTEGILLKEKYYTYNSFHLVSSIDESGLTTNYYYDFAGRLEEVVKGEQRQNLKYDSWGRVCEKKEWYGKEPHQYQLTVMQYDRLNRVIEEKILQDDTILRFNKYAYDERGNKVFSQNGEQITLTEYNSQNQPIKITNPAGEITHTNYNFRFIDSYGRQVLQTITTDPLGYQTIDTYDPANRLVEVQRKNPYGLLVSKQTSFYDLCGKLTRTQNHKIEEGKVKETIESYLDYTLDNQLCLFIEASGRPEQKISRYSYNAIGQKTEWIKNDGTLFYYTYDNLGRLQSLISSDGTIHYHYSYDEKDHVIKVEDIKNNQITERTYDLYGNLFSEKLGHELCLSYTYDLLNRIQSVNLPDETGIEYIFDACNLKKVQRISGNSYIHQIIEHTLLGKPVKSLLAGDSLEVNYTYDKAGRCTKIDAPHYKQEIPEKGYDPAGNLVLCHIQEEEYEYTYDDHYQIIREKEHEYQFDSLNNRIKKDGETAIYNALHQLIQKGTDSLLYDSNGNLIQRLENDAIIQYTYDALDRLVSVNQNGQFTTYTYDPFNRRLTRKNREEVKFIYQNQEEIGLWAEGCIKELRILDHRKMTIAIELENELYLPIQDILGNIVCIHNAQGKLIEHYRYTAFGESIILDPQNQVIAESIAKNPWQYSNKRRDAESGFIAFGLRYYDPGLGRWICPDPAGSIDGPNLYAYVHNNPLTFRDDYGLFTMSLMVRPQSDINETSFFDFKQKETSNFTNIESMMCGYNKLQNKISDTFYINPLAMGCNFSTSRPCEDMPLTFDVNSLKLRDPVTNSILQFQEYKHIMFAGVNGMGNTFQDSTQNALHFAQEVNANVTYVYSPSYGVGFDLLRSALGRAHIASETVREIYNLWDGFQSKDKRNCIFGKSHSRGAIDTNNALLLLPKEMAERIVILAVAPGVFMNPNLCSSVVHLVSSDPIPYLDPWGMLMHYSTIEFLERAPSAGFIDHSFTSETYIEGIKKYSNNFLRKYNN